jgi:hypothetical protein
MKNRNSVIRTAVLVVLIGLLAFTAFYRNRFADVSEDASEIDLGSKDWNMSPEEMNKLIAPTQEEVVEGFVSGDDIISFDERAWGEFQRIYVVHNDISSGLELYKNGKIRKNVLMDYCNDMIDSLSVSTEVLALDKTAYPYLAEMQIYAAANARAARKTTDYIKSNAPEDLRQAEASLLNAEIYANAITGGRSALLAKAGLSPGEVYEKVDSDLSALNNVVVSDMAR